MSVLVKGMKMPSRCCECDLEASGIMMYECMFINDYTNVVRENGRLKDCPLTEVKTPHGDLIDRDELIEDIANQVPYIIDDSDAQSYTNGLGAAKVSADVAPVVIKAEGAEE